jgi:hypothetical protein
VVERGLEMGNGMGFTVVALFRERGIEDVIALVQQQQVLVAFGKVGQFRVLSKNVRDDITLLWIDDEHDEGGR